LILGGAAAGALAILDMAFAAPVLVGLFMVLGLRKPYARLKKMAKARAEAMRNNMLIGLATINTLLQVSASIEGAARSASTIGGPFCNLMGLWVARINVRGEAVLALQDVRDHLPDPDDVEMNMFLRDVEANYTSHRELGPSVSALLNAVHRMVVEATEARAALVRQRSGLYGIFAILGMIFVMIAPLYIK